MKTTVLAAALLALLTSPAAAAERGPDRVPQEFVGDWCVDQNAPKASIDDEWWTAHGRNELAMISTRGSDAAVAAPTPPRRPCFLLEIHVGERLTVVIAHDETGVGFLSEPRGRKAAGLV